ncbi:porin family protein [Exilibacterium tricleocarpae]|uniref:Porin family protein n=1 Tax=Exilibacterium tricleocarpae TaxID=2591008 RepID=A0A545T6B0_9GAMM|nr:porin family protein [Exilibacterium tricleocarpae]TQV72702.1 porin family protein [Exilibacterium tricleocarpae]
MKVKHIALAVFGVSLWQSAALADTPAGQVYLGGGWGQSELADANNVDADVGKLYGGIQLSDYLALETEWIHLDDFEFDGFATRDNVESDTINLSAVFSHSLSERFSLLAKGGMHYTEIDVLNEDLENSGFSLGLGAQYDFSSGFGVRAEYQKLYNATNLNDDFELYSLGVRFNF